MLVRTQIIVFYIFLANLGKKMKIWERRLMKDFQVAPVAVEDENNDQPKTEEKGIARFRRIAKQVVDQTSSHRWGVAVKGIRDTQIGRCHNRESFKNQQNLQRAINEAKKYSFHYVIHRTFLSIILYYFLG